MTRAESQANLAYPEDIIDASPLSAYPNWIDRNLPFREGFVKGYKQAEKDLAPLIEAATIVYEAWNGGTIDDVRRGMVELGKRFKEEKK